MKEIVGLVVCYKYICMNFIYIYITSNLLLLLLSFFYFLARNRRGIKHFYALKIKCMKHKEKFEKNLSLGLGDVPRVMRIPICNYIKIGKRVLFETEQTPLNI